MISIFTKTTPLLLLDVMSINAFLLRSISLPFANEPLSLITITDFLFFSFVVLSVVPNGSFL
jgi:hypothetical protein